jgi:acetyl esterase/lipase
MKAILERKTALFIEGLTAQGGPPIYKLPVMMYFHGGGWILGSLRRRTIASAECKALLRTL